ncbi:MAG: PepSY-like domain-containing protein [Bacteroidales bacterium]|nr:PepSY-like domain-containing protein [Bacteroidales bacterium]
MKKIFAILALSMAVLTVAKAGDRPVTFNQLPAPAQTFINTNYPDDKISFATVDDDLIRPDYSVVLVSGVRIQFNNDGSLEKIESKAGVPEGLIPVQIRDYVKLHYPDAVFYEYEIGRRSYEVKLSNRLELKFNRNFYLVEIDD